MINKTFTIALIGNPNSGKTTLFNSLTKLRQTVGNWSGVTIEKKEGKYFKDKAINIIDLPGIYSLTPYSLEEKIARDFLINSKPDVVINIVDATNLERNLYLTSQLMEMNIKVVVALNMLDELESSGITIDEQKLEKILGLKVVSISALKNKNINTLMDITIEKIKTPRTTTKYISFPIDIEESLNKIKKLTNSSRFDSIKLFERDEISFAEVSPQNKQEIEVIISDIEKKYGEKNTELLSNARYKYIENGINIFQKSTLNKRALFSEKIDRIITNKYLAFPIFICIIWLMYFVSIQTLGGLGVKGMELLLENFKTIVRVSLENINIEAWIIGLLVDGIITGVGTVLSFLPQIILLFFFISLLEGCGYMARVAYIMDKLFRKIGLSGKSFIPMIVGCGCTVPAIMTTRTIENNDERRLTIMLTPFIPCSAKLPVFALFVGAFFPKNPFVAPSMYLLGIVMVIVGGLVLKKLKLFKTQSDTFVLELPHYRFPTARNILLDLWEKSRAFIIKAGTIIFLASIVLWAMQSFNWRFQMVEAEQSLLASLGNILAPLFRPLGFGNWKATVALLTGTVAKESVISSLSILLGTTGSDLTQSLTTIFTPLAAYSFMVFVLLSFPCIAALAATKKEMGSFKWMFLAMAFQISTAYTVSFLIYNIGGLFLYNKWIVLIPLFVAILAIGSFYGYKFIVKKRNIS